MKIRRRLLVKCPSCEDSFYTQFRDEFVVIPISEEQKKELKIIEDQNLKLWIETTYC